MPPSQLQSLDMERMRSWIGRAESSSDTIVPRPIAALSATLDRIDPLPQEGDLLPPLWSWLYFLPLHRMSELAEDGHAKRGGFLPPVPLPRRMFAGGRFTFSQPLRVGDRVERTSRIVEVTEKQGRTGQLVFVRVKHTITKAGATAVEEEQDIVYRGAKQAGEIGPAPQPSPSAAAWRREIHPQAVLLFRYSALTFNGHRIHYDRSFTSQSEGYPGLIVHGPLIATLLADLLRRNLPSATVDMFSFRSIRPIFDTALFTISGRFHESENRVELWAADAEGWLAMEATAIVHP